MPTESTTSQRAVLLLSGGIDSTTLMAQLSQKGYRIYALTFQYGQNHFVEIDLAKANGIKYGVYSHRIIDLDPAIFSNSSLIKGSNSVAKYNKKELPSGQTPAYVPYRNLIFISMALAYAESRDISNIFIACNEDDYENFWDCRATFFDQLSQINGTTNIQIHTPFLSIPKSKVIDLARQYNVDLSQTITCYAPQGFRECKVCLACRTKQNALTTSTADE